jgi:hypothetical protein
MRRTTFAGCVSLILLGGCVHQHSRPPSRPAATAPAAPATVPVTAPAIVPPASSPAATEPSVASASPASQTQTPAAAPAAQPGTPVEALPPRQDSTPPRGSSSRDNSSAPNKASAKPSGPVAAAGGPSTPAPAAAPGPAALDLQSLEQRLRDTRAIGLFTKLSLKNQVDGLLAQFKAFHQGQSPPTLTELRQRFELLLLKVVSLLQDGDAQLAVAISSSREALWAILSDPRKFAQV